METFDAKEHWEKIYSTKELNQCSWYQPDPRTSIDFFLSFKLAKEAAIIDVGAGDSYFVDYLLANGYSNITVLDISAKAIERAKKRLGANAKKVNWIASDILDFKPRIKYDFWHDRAAFHFLTQKEQVGKYINIARASIQPEKFLVVGTFSDSGPLKCSGLEIKQYSKEDLESSFVLNFKKIKCIDESHTTPFNTDQHFTFCSFQKLSQ